MNQDKFNTFMRAYADRLAAELARNTNIGRLVTTAARVAHARHAIYRGDYRCTYVSMPVLLHVCTELGIKPPGDSRAIDRHLERML